MLHALSGAAISPEWVRQVAEDTGMQAAQHLAVDAAAVVTGEVVLPAVPPPTQGLLALAGGWVTSRDNATGLEGKVAVLATGQEEIGRERRRLTDRRYVATFRPTQDFGPLVYRAAETQGIADAPSWWCWGTGPRGSVR